MLPGNFNIAVPKPLYCLDMDGLPTWPALIHPDKVFELIPINTYKTCVTKIFV